MRTLMTLSYWIQAQCSRSILRSPGAVAAVVVLAIGSGAAAGLYASVDSLFLAPLPFRQPERIFAADYSLDPVRRPTVEELGEIRRSLEEDSIVEVCAYVRTGWLGENLDPSTPRTVVNHYLVTPEFFSVLGVTPFLGRALNKDDTSHPDAIQPAVISYSLWKGRFEGTSAILGHVFKLDETTLEVVGVLPKGLNFPHGATLWTPLFEIGPGAVPALLLVSPVVAKFGHLQSRYPKLRFRPLAEACRPQDRLVFLYASGMTAVFFFITVLGLIPLRSLDIPRRRHEWALRLALGAPATMLRLESCVRCLRFAGLSLLLSSLILPVLRGVTVSTLPPQVFLEFSPSFSWRAAAIFFGLILIGSCVYCWPPSVVEVAPVSGLSARATFGSGSRYRWVTNAHRLCFTASVCAILYGTCLAALASSRAHATDLGFDVDEIVEFCLPPTRIGVSEANRLTLVGLLSEVERSPGVAAAAAALTRPLVPAAFRGTARIPGSLACQPISVRRNSVTTEYFRTLRIRFVSGRPFAQHSADEVVVNESLARWLRSCGGTDRLQVTADLGVVVGVVADTLERGPDHPVDPQVYFPMAHVRPLATRLLARVPDPRRRAAVKSLMLKAFPARDFIEVRTLSGDREAALGLYRGRVAMGALYASAAILVALVCITSSQVALVNSRKREFGIKLALGADPSSLARSLALASGVNGVLAITTGLGLGVGAGVAFRSLLFGVPAAHPGAAACVLLLFLGVVATSTQYTGRRISRLSTATVLRCE